uniref:Uncharacterized protein n=1 Tax=Rousettus aegyptiacus TaxID=9407 RepID=A0A7J8DI36_ROUAE|nr:hypothetical protein HJG63_008551 [Rousettus aegyptiacus]
MECSSTRCNVQNQGCTVLLRSSWSGLLLPFRRASKERARDYCHHNFFSLKNPTNSSIYLQRKRRCSDVGCCCWPMLGQPWQQCKDAVFPVYISISIYIYIYIYMLFLSQSLISDSTLQLGRWC